VLAAREARGGATVWRASGRVGISWPGPQPAVRDRPGGLDRR
jgi:hypothetical protein